MKFGARIYGLDRYTLLVKQTKGIAGGKYTLDGQREKHCHIADDAEIAEAVRAAISGRLPPKKPKQKEPACT
jgi:hypothetical protein